MFNALFSKSNKIFCIGRNKTGTTSLAQALRDLGIYVGNQNAAEKLILDYKNRNWKPIIKYCNSAEAFQDVPFSSPYTWLVLHSHFPDAKFILTVRDAEAWYNSLIRFHTTLFSSDKSNPPTALDLQNASYCYKGFMWDENRAVWNTPENDPYNKEILIHQYNTHNEIIAQYFKNQSNFLQLDVSEPNSYNLLCTFLNKTPLYKVFPHLNKSI